MTTPTRTSTGGSATADRIVRHARADRLLHWAIAVCVLTLLGTAFLPIVGVEFGWVTIHWVTGLALGVAVVLHVVRVLARGTWGRMWIGRADVALMSDDLSRLPWLIRHTRRALRVIRWHIGASLGVKAAFVALTMLGHASLWAPRSPPTWASRWRWSATPCGSCPSRRAARAEPLA